MVHVRGCGDPCVDGGGLLRRLDPGARALVLLGFVGLWIVVLMVRLVDLQLVRHDEWVKRARRQQERTVELPPRRGAIADRDGRPLAVSALVPSLFAIPSDVVDPHAAAVALAPLVGQKAKELERKLANREKEFVWIARRVPEEAARRVAALRIAGVRLLPESTRRYPQGTLAASVVGYVGTDNQGLAGLEYRFDSAVRGRPARVTLLRDAAQRSYATAAGARRGARSAVEEGVEGASLVLTIDSRIQNVAERELEGAVNAYHARGGSVVVLDPENGALLALASSPAFDPNRFGDVQAEARRCQPIEDTYEPGSTFKAVTAAAALEAGTISPNDLIDCGGGTLTVGGSTIHEHGRNRWGVLTLGEVIAHSSNVGIAHVALGLGRGPFNTAVRSLGFGQRTGVEVEGESAGILADPAGWSALTLPTMSFGQEIGVTVLQMARAYAAFASGGLLPTPHLVAEVVHTDGRRERPNVPGPRRVMSERTAGQVRDLLARVVLSGTGTLAQVPGWEVAGKTGTAQKAVPGGGYSRERYVASFIGFAPARSPRLVVAVVVDEPKGKIYGGDVAAPVFAAVVGESLRLLREPSRLPARVPPVLTADLAAGAAAGTAHVLTGDLLPAASRDDRSRENSRSAPHADLIPDLTGLSARDAVRRLARIGCEAKLAGEGFVVGQEPAPGSSLPCESAVSISLSLVPPSERAALDAAPEGTR